jgi:prolyl 4-hydroxylase
MQKNIDWILQDCNMYIKQENIENKEYHHVFELGNGTLYIDININGIQKKTSYRFINPDNIIFELITQNNNEYNHDFNFNKPIDTKIYVVNKQIFLRLIYEWRNTIKVIDLIKICDNELITYTKEQQPCLKIDCDIMLDKLPPFLYMGTIFNEKIKLTWIDNFITQKECQTLINIANKNVQPYRIFSKTSIDFIHSDTCYLSKNNHVVKKLTQKIANITGVMISQLENFHIIKYGIGDYFRPHYDSFDSDIVKKENNQRQYTILIYLNDDFEGGITKFIKLNQEFTPKIGAVLIWENCYAMNHVHLESLHTGMRVNTGYKYIMTTQSRFNEIHSSQLLPKKSWWLL